MTSEEQEKPGTGTPEALCERCGDYGVLRKVSTRDLCHACIERLPAVIRTPPSTGSLVRGIGWIIARGVWVALPLAVACQLAGELLTWAVGLDSFWFISIVAMVPDVFVGLVLLAVFFAILHGDAVDLRDSTRRAADAFLSGLTTNLYGGFVIGLACLAFLIPGLVYATRYTLIDAVVLYEGKGGGAALNRSTAYVDGIGWPVFGAMCVVLMPPLLVGVVGAFAYGYYYPLESGVFLTPPLLIPLEVFTSSAISIGSAALVAVTYANRRFQRLPDARSTAAATASPTAAR
jgi:hypothetical protein